MDAAARGVLGASRGDDWSYLRTAFHFAASGHFHLNGWASMNLVGQVAMAWPVIKLAGATVAGLQAFVALLAALTLWIWFLVLRRVLPPWQAAVACGTLAFCPVFGRLAVSFMTDVPALFAQAVVLLAGIKAIENDERCWRWVALAGVSGVLAFSIREYSVVAVVAVFGVLTLRERSAGDWRRLGRVVGAGVLVALALGVIWRWRHHQPYDYPLAIGLQVPQKIANDLAKLSLTLAVFLAPATLFISPGALLRRARSRPLALAAMLFVPGCFVASKGTVLIGDYMSRGSFDVPGGSPLAGRAAPWALLCALAAYSLAVLSLLLAGAAADGVAALRSRRRAHVTRAIAVRPVECMLGSLAAGSVLLFTAIVAVTPRFFDRYLLMAVPPLAALSLFEAGRVHAFRRGPARRAAILAMSCLGIVGLSLVDAAAAYEGAQWRLANREVAGGMPAASIDGGFGWYGLHSTVIAQPERDLDPGRSWYASILPGSVCEIVTAAGPNDRPMASTQAHTLFGQLTAVVVRGPDACAETVARP